MSDGGARRDVSVPPDQMLGEADKGIARSEAGRSGVARQLATARQQRDVVKTLCLNDKLNQVDVALRSAQERRDALEAATRAGDRERATHEFTVLTVLGERTEQVLSEATQCVGEEVALVSEGAISMEVTGVPEEDAEIPEISIVVDPPQCSSCFD